MSSERHQEMFRIVIEEAFNKGNFDVLDELFAPDYTEHQFGLKPTLDGMKEDFAFLRRAFPDLHMTIEDMIADEDTVWGRMTATGTNLGPFIGPPTGKHMEITVIDILRFANGRVVDHWGSPDRFAAIAQLGLLPQSQR
ncbi:MAG: ester cyclase [Anaerolineaceae bacterium]|nr:ester cyclase [Anaerolineaceae bacterium]